MIFVDRRIGSAELAKFIPSSAVVSLDYGDFAFVGKGPDGEVMIGIERKSIRDLVSCMMTGRYTGYQLIGMKDTYWWSYVIVEGIWRASPVDGLLEVRNGPQWVPLRIGAQSFSARDIWCHMNSLDLLAGISVRRTENQQQTAYLVNSLYAWWNKDWDKHHSHQAMKVTPEFQMQKASTAKRIAAELPGVGWVKSQAVIDAFPTVADMVGAAEKDWQKVDGIGKTLSRRIYSALRGKEPPQK